MVLIHDYQIGNGTESRTSFRPLAGIMVLIRKMGALILSYILSFRPLAGIMVLIIFANGGSIAALNVSVPLRGLWFLSDISSLPMVNDVDEVSVPLRGLWFLSARGRAY